MLENDALNWVDLLGLAASEARSAATDAAYARDKAHLITATKDLVEIMARIGEAVVKCGDVEPFEAEFVERRYQFEVTYARLRNNPSSLHDFTLENQVPLFLLRGHHTALYWRAMQAHYATASTYFDIEAERWGYYEKIAQKVQTGASLAGLALGGASAYMHGGRALLVRYGGRVLGGVVVGQVTAPLKNSVRTNLGISEQQRHYFDIAMQVVGLFNMAGRGPSLGVNANSHPSRIIQPAQPPRAAETTSRAARREAMRDAGTPTSRPATSQSGSGSHRQYVTEGADGKPRVQTQHPPDEDHPPAHWHDAEPKVDPRTGELIRNRHGQVKYKSDGTSVGYEE